MNAVERLMSDTFGDFGAAKPKEAPKPAKVKPAKVKPAKAKPANSKPATKVAAKPKPSDVTKKESKVATIPAKVTPKGQYVLKKGLNPDNSPPEVVAAIKKLQTALGMKVAASEAGFFGGKTHDAVIAFQRKVGFVGKDLDGVVGDKTWDKLLVAPTPAGKAQATVNAAVTAATELKKQATPKPSVAPAATTATNPLAAAVQRTTAVAQPAVKVATQTAAKAKDAVVKTHVVIKKQPLWLQVVTFAAAGLGAVAGIAALKGKRKAASA